MDSTKFKALKALVNRLAQQYADDVNITGIGWGTAERGGQIEPGLAIVFFVREKLAPEKLVERQTVPIPAEIDGYPTDVRVLGNITRQADMAGSRNDDVYDPLLGGVVSANLEQLDRTFFWPKGSVGTLGILCQDSNGNPMALSNWHVWADNGAKNGDRIVQPSRPTLGGYTEGVAKTIFCLPIIGSLLEGRLPSGLAAALYGGAAAAATLAALTDERDPFRRGEDATPNAETAITHEEHLAVRLDYPESPALPGKAFKTDVKWAYERLTNKGRMGIEVSETQINPHVLPGYIVVPEYSSYQKGQRLTLRAALWDYQPRPADAYHVVAHLVSQKDPSYQLKVLLHPDENCQSFDLLSATPRHTSHQAQPVYRTEEKICLDFSYYPPDYKFGLDVNIGPFALADYDSQTLTTTEQGGAMRLLSGGILVHHPPAIHVTLHMRNRAETPVAIRALNAFEEVVAEVQVGRTGEEAAVIELSGDMITHVRTTGGNNASDLLMYCIDPVTTDNTSSHNPMLDYQEITCVDFTDFEEGQTFDVTHEFNPITITDMSNTRLQIVNWSNIPNSLYVRREGLSIKHAPADYVRVRVSYFTSEPITILAYNQHGKEVAKVIVEEGGVLSYVELRAEGIVKVTLTGGEHEEVLTEYCVQSKVGEVRHYKRHCFKGELPLQSDAPSGRWRVYLVTQNINPVPMGTDPELAATSIGGTVLGVGGLFVLACGFVMLADHVFDIF